MVELGLITEKKIKRNAMLFNIWLPFFIAFVLTSVYAVNGARGFWDGFWQILIIIMTEGLFDRLFIDFFWVNRTNAWTIKGTEDLNPLVGYPILAAGFAALMSLLIK